MTQYNEITKLISELLYKHDCVIVPNFGGFVAQLYSSHFSKGSSSLLPPTKQVLFNKNLKHNDGLLITAFAERFDVNYDLAIVEIENYKEYIVSLLFAKKRFELLNLGLLYIDNDNEIRFEPKIDVNFLIDSFGFEPVIANEIEAVVESRILKPVFEDRKVNIEKKSSKKYSVKQMVLLAIGIPITMTLLIFAANSKPMHPIMHSSMNPLYSAPKTYSKLSQNDHKTFYLDKIVSEELIADNNGNAVFKLVDDGVTLVATSNDLSNINSVVKVKSKLGVVNVNAAYQVVVGCFGVEKNAAKLISELNSKNIVAAMSGLNSKGMHIVSCGGFNTKNEANELLNSLKNNFPNAWVMTK